ncbi:hypothetical protein ABPG77_003793 [Micractinium sp. CCAP 211/92]
MADLFDSALNLEEQFWQEGYEEGLRDGRRSGRDGGRGLGLQKGFEIGHEVGFYAGCCQLWRQLQAREPALFSQRVDKGIAAMEEAVRSFPLGDPKDERLQDLMDALRGKFKAVAAGLGLTDAALFPQQQDGQGGGGGGGGSASALQF